MYKSFKSYEKAVFDDESDERLNSSVASVALIIVQIISRLEHKTRVTRHFIMAAYFTLVGAVHLTHIHQSEVFESKLLLSLL